MSNDYYAHLLWPMYQLNMDAGCSHEDIVSAVEAYFGGPAPDGAWRLVQLWYRNKTMAQWSYEKGNIRRAYNAMMELQAVDYSPARVRSRVGMMKLMAAVFGGKPRVRWSWPAEHVARAQYAQAWP